MAKKAAVSPSRWQDRVKELRRVPGRELMANPKNWRTHEDEQRNTLTRVLDRVGKAGALLARDTDEGLQLIDGHLRTALDPDELWPVLVLDVSEEEAKFILLTHDPIGAMAGTDADMLSSLIAEGIEVDGSLEDLLTDIGELYGLEFESDGDDTPIVEDEIPEPPKDPITKPGDVWLLGVYFECDACGKQYSPAEAEQMKGECACG